LSRHLHVHTYVHIGSKFKIGKFSCSNKTSEHLKIDCTVSFKLEELYERI
jgi:hypothetical protein